MNSPYPRTNSPLSQIDDIFDLSFWKDSTSLYCLNSPLFKIAQGPSAISQGVIAHAFPGLSIFICVPTVMKSSIAAIDAALQEPAASPDGLARPYLSRNPPASRGAPKTGLPAIISFINLEITGTLLDVNPFPSLSLDLSLFLFAKTEIKSQPGTFSLSVCL